ncbi:hypothetical protein [Lyngbya aestuarii]|uniref:hypothetical protein n=1 Tax=Lyngbya aestuarii TaxID=118322 RepID=UPI00403D9645
MANSLQSLIPSVYVGCTIIEESVYAVTVPSELTIEATAIVFNPRSTPQTFLGFPILGGVIWKGTAKNTPL